MKDTSKLSGAWPILAALLALVVYLGWRQMRGTPHPGPLASAEDEQAPPHKRAPQFEFTDQHGSAVTPASLLGKVWIADFFFTTCTSICPGLTAKFVLLQNRLESPELRFVSFSVDPPNDTPQALARYASGWNPDESRWTLLATREPELYDVARGFDVFVMPSGIEDDPIMHSGRFFLVDREGLFRGSYNSEDEEAIERLVVDAMALAAQPESAGHSLRKRGGAALFTSLGCAGCHLEKRLAPPLAGIAGREVELEGGARRTADEAYLRESILDPAAQLVAGYRPTMPSYRGLLDDAQLAKLIEHVRSLAAPESAPAEAQSAAPQSVIDPVCEEPITVFDDSPSREYRGRRYFFCCEHCQAGFDADPAKYAKP